MERERVTEESSRQSWSLPRSTQGLFGLTRKALFNEPSDGSDDVCSTPAPTYTHMHAHTHRRQYVVLIFTLMAVFPTGAKLGARSSI